MLSAYALAGLPAITPGDDLASLIVGALEHPLQLGDVVVVAHKVVSKSEGQIRRLAEVRPGDRALRLAREHDKDPRHVQVVLDQSQSLLRAAHGVLICETHHGFICANAGVDASNAPDTDTVIVLPVDPDRSARGLRDRIKALTGARPAVLITDSFGRAWRHGQVDVVIGCAGLAPIEDWRGRVDASGRELKATRIAAADELAAAADLIRTKDGLQPVVVVRGAGRHVIDDDGPGVQALLRAEAEDLFR